MKCNEIPPRHILHINTDMFALLFVTRFTDTDLSYNLVVIYLIPFISTLF